MKELCCKILAVMFIGLMILSLIGMRNDIQKIFHAQPMIQSTSRICTFDTVLVGGQKNIGVVEQITNNLYHVVYRDPLGHPIHGIYTKNQLQKVLIVTPYTHE